jgi:hypothetical protein
MSNATRRKCGALRSIRGTLWRSIGFRFGLGQASLPGKKTDQEASWDGTE